jgi:hypothetical protein
MKVKPQILCPLTDWETHTTTRGIGTGRVIKGRTVLAADPHNWILGTQREDLPNVISDRAFFGSIKHVLSNLPKDGNKVEMINNIIGSLVKRTGLEAELTMDNPYDDLAALGKWIDDQFNTSFHNDTQTLCLYKNIFKTNEDIKED